MKENDSLVDENPAIHSTADITIDNGYNFGPATRATAWAFLAFGVFAIYMGGGGIFIGIFTILAGFFALTSKNGTQVCLSNGYIREYSAVLGLKTGKWQTTAALPDITVMKLGKKRETAGFIPGLPGMPTVGMEMDASVNEVYLLSADHRKRVLLKVCNSAKEGFEFAKDLALKMGKNVVEFNPKISEVTLARRLAERRK